MWPKPESVKKVGGEWNGWRRTHYFNGRPEKRGNNAVSNGQRAITLIPVSSIRGRPAAASLALLAPIFDSFAAIMSKFLKVPGCQREKYWQILIRKGEGGIRDPSERLIICTKHSRFAWRDPAHGRGFESSSSEWATLVRTACLDCDGCDWSDCVIRLHFFIGSQRDQTHSMSCQARVW